MRDTAGFQGHGAEDHVLVASTAEVRTVQSQGVRGCAPCNGSGALPTSSGLWAAWRPWAPGCIAQPGPPSSRGLLPRVCFCPASFTRTCVDLGPTRVVWVPSCRAPEYACRDHRLCCPPGMGAVSVAQRPQPGVLGRFHVPCLDWASLAPDPGPPPQGPPRWEAAVGRKASGSWAVPNSTCWV